MNVRELIQTWRSEVDDATGPDYLWSRDEALQYLNEAVVEAARRSRAFIDSNTVAITRITTTANVGLYPLDPRVMFIRHARFANKLPLHRMSSRDMDQRDRYWRDTKPSTPTCFVTDVETGKVLLWPAPTTAGTLLMTVVRDPLNVLDDDEDIPEIPVRAHHSLIHWMSHRGYRKQDSETKDEGKSASALELFEAEFGKKSSLIDELWIEREQLDGDGSFT